MNGLLQLSDVALLDLAELSEAEFGELENQLVLRAASLGWTGDPLRQPAQTVAAIVRQIIARR